MPAAKHSPKDKIAAFVKDALRILDANFNRSKEGMRVCEDICRFHLNDPDQAATLNKMRHRLTEIMNNADLDLTLLFSFRDAEKDVGKNFSFGPKRKSFKAIFLANTQRVKEALRVIEEFLKPFGIKNAKKIQKLRFEFYEFEKKIIKKFTSLSNP